MAKRTLTAGQKRICADLWIIGLISLLSLSLYILFQKPLSAFIKDGDKNILLRVLSAAAFQFGLAGLGISVVGVLRKERFSDYGLKMKGAFLSILLCSLSFVPYIIFSLVTKTADPYLPFQSVWTTADALKSPFPQNVAAMGLTAAAWGFFEAFNYVVISDKINKAYPPKNIWLNPGAIVCAILCILIHGAVGVSLAGIIEMLCIFLIIYGMLIARYFTDNAWGCVFIFLFLWNAF